MAKKLLMTQVFSEIWNAEPVATARASGRRYTTINFDEFSSVLRSKDLASQPRTIRDKWLNAAACGVFEVNEGHPDLALVDISKLAIKLHRTYVPMDPRVRTHNPEVLNTKTPAAEDGQTSQEGSL